MMYCCLCGRRTATATVTIGDYPVGPKCARRAGLLELSKRKTGLVCPVVRYPKKSGPDLSQPELWTDDDDR